MQGLWGPARPASAAPPTEPRACRAPDPARALGSRRPTTPPPVRHNNTGLSGAATPLPRGPAPGPCCSLRRHGAPPPGPAPSGSLRALSRPWRVRGSCPWPVHPSCPPPQSGSSLTAHCISIWSSKLPGGSESGHPCSHLHQETEGAVLPPPPGDGGLCSHLHEETGGCCEVTLEMGCIKDVLEEPTETNCTSSQTAQGRGHMGA